MVVGFRSSVIALLGTLFGVLVVLWSSSVEAQTSCPTISGSGASQTVSGTQNATCTVTGSNNTITVTDTGVMTSPSGPVLLFNELTRPATPALPITTTGNVVNNQGTIGSATQATSIQTELASNGTLTVNNSGTIIGTIVQALPAAGLTNSGWGGLLSINNQAGGTIRSASGLSTDLAISDVSANNINTNMYVRNSGTITGSLALGVSPDTVINSGTINGNIDFGAAGSRKGVLVLRPGWQITGVATSQGATLASIAARAPATLGLSGSGSSSLDASQIGSITSGLKFQGFSGFVKEGPGTWTLTGTIDAGYLPINNVAPAWWVAQGRLVGTVASIGWNVTFGDRLNVEGATGFVAGNVCCGSSPTGYGADPDFLPTAGGSAILEFAQTTNATFSKTITQCNAVDAVCAVPIVGSIVKSGAGTLTLSGVNTYSGGTTIAEGALAVAADSALGASGGGLAFAGGTFQVLADFTSARAVSVATGGGTIDTAGRQLTLSGSVSGSGGLTKGGAGTLILSGANTLTGLTDVQAGTLRLTGGSAIADTATVVVRSTATLDVATNETIGNLVSAGTIDGAGRTLTAASYTFDGGTVNANLGAGTLIQRTGTTTLNATADAGTVAVTGGALRLGANNRLSGTAALTVSGGTLDLSGFSQTVSSLVLAGGSVANGSLSASGGYELQSGSVSGALGGPGGVTKTTAGAVTLSGTNTYTGQTAVQEGTLTLASAGSIANTGAVTVGASGTLSLAVDKVLGSLVSAGTIAGTGQTLTASTYIFDGGTVNANLGIGALTQRSGTTLLAGASAAGTVSVNGGTLQLGGNNRLASAAALTVAGGTLDLGGFSQSLATVTLSGGSIDNGTLTSATAFDLRSGSIGASLAGAIGLSKSTLGTVILSGANSYTGSTVISGGTLQVGNGGTTGSLGSGAVLNNGTLAFNRADSLIVANAISGSGGLVQAGAGSVNLTGPNSYTGPTSVLSGQLSINGSIASNTVVAEAGTLGGNGTITGAVTVNGAIAPGNSIGTLNVVGAYVQNANSVYRVEIAPGGQGDRIAIAGTASLNGGTVSVLPTTTAGFQNTTYTILSATGGVSGTFAGVTTDFAFLRPYLAYDPNNVYLTVKVSFGDGPLTTNQQAVGRALDAVGPSATGDFAAVVGTLSLLNAQQGPAALDAIGGEPYANVRTVNVASALLYMETVGRQIASARAGYGNERAAIAQACLASCEEPSTLSPIGVWATAMGGAGNVQGDGNGSTLTYNVGGFAAGIDYRFQPAFLAGVSIGTTTASQWVDGFPGSAGSTSVQGSVYASLAAGAFYVDALAGYAYSNNQATRTILIPGLQPRTARSSAGANQLFGQVETGYRLALWDAAAANLTPFLRFQGAALGQDAFGEWGANALNLNVAAQSSASVRTVLGAQADAALEVGWRDRLAVQFRLGWAHEYADTTRAMTASFAGAPGASFTVYGVQPSRNSVTLGLASSTAVGDGTSLYLRYDGEVGAGFDRHSLGLGIQFRL